MQLLSLFGFDFSKKNYVRSKKDFLLTPSVADENDLALVYYSISVGLCKKIVKIYALYADSNCLEYISDSYKKQQVFTSKSTVFYSQ